jgi:hypothetical protein
VCYNHFHINVFHVLLCQVCMSKKNLWVFWIECILCCGLSSWVCSINCQQDVLAQMLVLGWKEVEGFQVPSWNDETKQRTNMKWMQKSTTTKFPNEMNYGNVWEPLKNFKGNLGNQISSLVGKISIQNIIWQGHIVKTSMKAWSYNQIWKVRTKMPQVFWNHIRANPSLGGTTRNITPQNFEIDSTSKQHGTRFFKTFHFKFYIKRLPTHVQLETSIEFTKKLILIF